MDSLGSTERVLKLLFWGGESNELDTEVKTGKESRFYIDTQTTRWEQIPWPKSKIIIYYCF